MSKLTIELEKVAEIRYALREILFEAQHHIEVPIIRHYIIKQVKRIDKLLPDIISKWVKI